MFGLLFIEARYHAAVTARAVDDGAVVVAPEELWKATQRIGLPFVCIAYRVRAK